MNKKEQSKIIKEIEQSINTYVEGYLQMDMEKLLGFWANTEDFISAADGSLVVGYENFVEQMRIGSIKVEKTTRMEFSDVHIVVLTKDVATYSMKFNWSKTMKTGEVVSSKGSWTYVLKKFGDTWKTVNSAGTHLYY